ncbi:MAG TPA: hypothetical protein VFT43_11740 [Candidatus Polarisedimenticolia bacterium]|nr:hypothetical protein [Candidatus Polarisedimenticolia bacterium]
MDGVADAGEAQARLLEQLAERLEAAEGLCGEMRAALSRAESQPIEAATARLATIVLEARLLAEEYRRLAESGAVVSDDERVVRARAALEQSAARLIRSSALSSGLLERLVTLQRGLLSILGCSAIDAYLPSGRAPEFAPRGLRLTERA